MLAAVYRGVAAHEQSEPVVYGPFPVRLGLLAGACATLAIGVLFGLMYFSEMTLACDRASDRCTMRGMRLFDQRQQSFKLSDLHGVSVAIELGSKNARYGRPQLHLGKPAVRLLPLRKVSVDEAKRFAAALEHHLDTQPARFSVSLRESLMIALLGLGFLVFGATLALSSVRGIGRVVFSLRMGTLSATRRLLGTTRERWTVDVAGADDVEVAWSRRKSFWDRKHHPGTTHGMLVLRMRDGSTRNLTSAPRRGFHVHVRAERALRDRLELPSRSTERQAALDVAAKIFEPPALMGGGAGAKFGLIWIGICCGAVFGMALLGVVLLVTGWAQGSDSLQTWQLALGLGGGAVTGVMTAFRLERRANNL